VSGAWVDRVRQAYADSLTGTDGEVSVDEGFGPVGVDVPADHWVQAMTVARDVLGCSYFDWLSAVDESGPGVRLVCHLAARRTGAVEHLLLRTLLSSERPAVATAAGVFAGARWHERETHEMFGVDFTDEGEVLPLEPLLLPAQFVGHPLRKDFVLASRVAKPWPGAKEPGESDAAPRPARSRRRGRPPGVPLPDEWGPR
jgi:NADH:ubiquinone oxidoreductase subunit C